MEGLDGIDRHRTDRDVWRQDAGLTGEAGLEVL